MASESDEELQEEEEAEATEVENRRYECTIGVYSKEDMSEDNKKICHYLTRLNHEFFKCSVYDSHDPSTARLLGVEYIVSERIFNVLPPDEQKLWHSHVYEIKENLWINMLVIEILEMTELENMSRCYGKFWGTWQLDNGDALPLGAPSPLGMVEHELLDAMPTNDHSDVEGGEWECRKSKRRERFITYVRRIKRECKLNTCDIPF